ncbi:MAG: hypothetical protein NTZ35_11410, partial [Ignavibacteriales bacterium]|nr:hypothetical protein [Ignavibacteriales bacterium]
MRTKATFTWILLIAAILCQSANSQSRVHLYVSSSAEYIVTDPVGRHTGIDPRYSRPSEQWTWLEQIPNATIGYNTSNEEGPSSIDFEILFNSPEGDGVYTIVLIADRLTISGLVANITSIDNPLQLQHPYFQVDGIPIEKDSAVTYLFTYHGAPGAPVSLVKVVSASSLVRDVAAMLKLNWITTQPIADKYVTLINSYSTQLQQNNYTGARGSLISILQSLTSDSLTNLTADACKSLRRDVEYLIAQLPVTPPSGVNVKLINSSGTNLTGGSLQYYDGSWKDAVNNNDGTFKVNTTLATVSLRMTYEGGSQTKSNVAVGPNVVVFQTVNTQVKLQNSQGALIDTGTVQYYYSSWQALGRTMNGAATKELLPATYTFRMTYATATNDKQQDIGTNPTVVFTTVNAAVQLKNSQGSFIDQGTVQYYFSSWQNLGTTTNGVATKELLPGAYTF